jgi:hypothetical protein
MKKLLLTIVVLFILAVLAAWLLIPGTLTVTTAVKAPCNSQAAFRKMSADSIWRHWDDGGEGVRFMLTKKTMTGFEIQASRKGNTYPATMVLIPLKSDTTILNWQLTMQAGANPFLRIGNYRAALAIKKAMERTIRDMQTYLSSFENVYGFQLQESSTTDTIFISTKAISPVYPATSFIYSMIDTLTIFCKEQGCTITGYPMLNITSIDSGRYQVRTALPVNRLMQERGNISTGKMVKGKFIVTDVTGGQYAVDQRLQQIRNYFQDYNRTSMAIPFSYLITDRRQELDSAKWHTRVYAPVY